MKNIIKYLLLSLIVLSAAACQKDSIMVFDINDGGVLFPGADRKSVV